MSSVQQLELGFEKFEARIVSDRLTSGLTLWTSVFKRLVSKIKRRDDEIYKELMLMELEAPKDSKVLLERIAKMKGLIAFSMIALTGVALWMGEDSKLRNRPRCVVKVRIENSNTVVNG